MVCFILRYCSNPFIAMIKDFKKQTNTCDKREVLCLKDNWSLVFLRRAVHKTHIALVLNKWNVTDKEILNEAALGPEINIFHPLIIAREGLILTLGVKLTDMGQNDSSVRISNWSRSNILSDLVQVQEKGFLPSQLHHENRQAYSIKEFRCDD